jgi:hypothetical protein
MPYPEQMDNMLSQHLEFTGSDWQMGSSLIIPETDGLIYVGWHAESISGLGIFLDDVMIEDFGTVGLEESPENSELLVYDRAGNIVISATPDWNGSEVRVMNLMGQMVYNAVYRGSTLQVSGLEDTGIYLVNLISGDRIETRKVLVR